HRNHKLQSRPDFIDCANFDIYQAVAQRDLANYVLINISLDLRSTLGPRNPKNSIRYQRAPEPENALLELLPLCGKELDEVDRRLEAAGPLEVGRQLTEYFTIIGRLVDQDIFRTRLEAKFLR